MVYQEQVMQIVHELGGIKLRDAYSLIKNISKKKHDKIEKERPSSSTARAEGPRKKQADDLFELILKFAGLRLQQEPLDRLRHRRVPDRVPEDRISPTSTWPRS
jgi:hypothetical protein